MRKLRAICATVAVVLTLSARASMQTTGTTAVWQGWLQCQVTTQADGFTNRQTHTWTITGPPVIVGAIAEYPATWTVTGEGAQRGVTPGQATGQWTSSGSMPSARIGIFIRASDNRLVALLRSSQLTVAGATSGTQQVAGESRRISLAVSEWRPLPAIEDAPASTHLTGSTPMPITNRIDMLQPASATGQTDCSWDFAQSPSVPAPVPAVTPSAALGGATTGISKKSPSVAGTPIRQPDSIGSRASSVAGGIGSAGGAAASAVNTVDAAVAPSGPVKAAFSGPGNLAVSAAGTFQLTVTLPMSQTSTVTQTQAPTTTTTPTTQTVTTVSMSTRTTQAFVVISGEVIFTATTHPLNQLLTPQKQIATIKLPASSAYSQPASTTFQFPVPGTHSVSAVGSVVVEHRLLSQRTVTTKTTKHDATCNCSDQTNTATSIEPEQTQVLSSTLYMMGAPPAASATLQVAVK